jgi:hypothetical protein
MVTKLCAGKPRGAEYDLPVWFFLKFKGFLIVTVRIAGLR